MKVNKVSYIDANKPFIRLSGLWLSEKGFSVGTFYEVKCYENKIVLIAENERQQ